MSNSKNTNILLKLQSAVNEIDTVLDLLVDASKQRDKPFSGNQVGPGLPPEVQGIWTLVSGPVPEAVDSELRRLRPDVYKPVRGAAGFHETVWMAWMFQVDALARPSAWFQVTITKNQSAWTKGVRDVYNLHQSDIMIEYWTYTKDGEPANRRSHSVKSHMTVPEICEAYALELQASMHADANFRTPMASLLRDHVKDSVGLSRSACKYTHSLYRVCNACVDQAKNAADENERLDILDIPEGMTVVHVPARNCDNVDCESWE